MHDTILHDPCDDKKTRFGVCDQCRDNGLLKLKVNRWLCSTCLAGAARGEGVEQAI